LKFNGKNSSDRLDKLCNAQARARARALPRISQFKYLVITNDECELTNDSAEKTDWYKSSIIL